MHLDEPGTVIHLHGAASNPESMVVTTREYLEHYDDRTVQHFLGELFEKKTVLFVGYGLKEVEVLEHILRRGSARASTQERRRFALQGYFFSQARLYERLHRYYERSFGVHVIGFPLDYATYDQQTDILNHWAQRLKVKRQPLVDDIAKIDEVLGAG